MWPYLANSKVPPWCSMRFRTGEYSGQSIVKTVFDLRKSCVRQIERIVLLKCHPITLDVQHNFMLDLPVHVTLEVECTNWHDKLIFAMTVYSIPNHYTPIGPSVMFSNACVGKFFSLWCHTHPLHPPLGTKPGLIGKISCSQLCGETRKCPGKLIWGMECTCNGQLTSDYRRSNAWFSLPLQVKRYHSESSSSSLDNACQAVPLLSRA